MRSRLLLVSLSPCLVAWLCGGCASHAAHKPTRAAAHPLPKEDAKVALKRALTALANGQADTLAGLSTFASNDQKTAVKHLVPQAQALREIQQALVARFGNAGKLGDDPLPALMASVDNATVRFEPSTARVIPPPPNPPYTLAAVGGHWKLDFGRSQLFPDRPVAPKDLQAIDEYTRYLRNLPKEIRGGKFGSVEMALGALDPRHPDGTASSRGSASQPATAPAVLPQNAMPSRVPSPGPDVPPPEGSPALAPPQ